MKFFKLAIFVLVCSLFSTPVSAQLISNRALQADIKVIKEEVEALQRSVYRTGDVKKEESSDLQIQVGQMDEIFRSTTGKIEELEHKIRSLEERVEMINKDMDIRFKMLEEKSGSVSPASSNPTPATPTAPLNNITADISGNVDELYQKGLDALKAKDHQTAINAFAKILNTSPTHKLAGNAQYWLGETYYAQKDFKMAAISFAKGYESYKSGAKGADSLLKLGMSMIELKENTNACSAFQNLSKEFPSASDILKNKARDLAKKYSCK